MKIPERAPEAFKDLGMRAVRVMSDVLDILRGNVTLRDHLNIDTVTHTFGGVADTEEDIDISDLGIDYTPSQMWVLEVDKGAVIYVDNKAGWSSTTLKAKSSVAGTTVTLAVF